MGIKNCVISRPQDCTDNNKPKNYYLLNSENIIKIFNSVNVVINTIPFNIIPEEALNTKNNPYILDIASFPYGVDENIIRKYKDKINYKLYLGIPSKFAPKEASEILLKILKYKV